MAGEIGEPAAEAHREPVAPKPERPAMHLQLRIAALSIALALALAACNSGQDAAQEMGPTEVTVVTLKTEKVDLKQTLAGRVTSSMVAEVRPQVDGIIRERLFEEGADVKQGQALYQIDDASYRAQADSARAQLLRAQASADSAHRTAARARELAGADAISRQDLDNAEATEKQSAADVAAARAALAQANVTLGYTTIRAPISGRVGRSSVTRGALVGTAQQSPLATIQQLDPIYIDVTQSSAELLQMRKALAAGQVKDNQSQPVDIVLEDGTTFDQKGTLELSEVSVDPSTGSFALRVKVSNPDGVLMPGMYVRAELGAGTREQAVLVPMQGITRDPKGQALAMIVNAKGKAEQRQVEVGQSLGDKWLVTAGLKPGDKVIVEGLQKIAADSDVVATEAGSQPQADEAGAQQGEAMTSGHSPESAKN